MKKPKRIILRKSQLTPAQTVELTKFLTKAAAAATQFGMAMLHVSEAMNTIAAGVKRPAEMARPELEFQMLKYQSWQRNYLADTLDESGIKHEL